MKGVTLPYRIHLSKLLNSVGRLYIVSEALHFKWKKGLMFVGFSRDDKHISENTVNIALRTMGYDTKKHGFRTMACSALIEFQIIKDMKIRGLSDSEISEITGYSSNWVNSINMLLDKGEHKLLSAVERGNLPLYLAVEFARCETEEAQNLLTEAYDKKIIKSRDIIKIKHILNQRETGNKGTKSGGFFYHKPAKKMSAEELISLYENSIAEHKTVCKHSKFVKTNLLIVNEIFNIIMMNKSFQNLLEQENLSELPSQIINPLNKEISQ